MSKEKLSVESDSVNNPAYYNIGNFEVIDVILDWKLDYIEGNIIKYISRWRYKGGLEDLQKAQWYLNKLIEEGANADSSSAVL